MIAHAGASYVLADSSKLGKVAVHRVCALTQVTAVITNADNSNIEAEAANALAAAGCDMLRPPSKRPRRSNSVNLPASRGRRDTHGSGHHVACRRR
jgi:hypothetical protein